MIKNIIFDVGDVLIEYRWKDMLLEHGIEEERAEAIGSRMFGDDVWAELDAGNVSVQDAIEVYEKQYKEYATDIRWFLEHAELMKVDRPEVWKRVKQLKEAGYKIYLLSNYSEELFEKHTKGADFHNHLDGGIVSYQIHKLKPDPEIYQSLLEKYELDPTECLFFDDRAENTKAAEELGIKAVTVISQQQLLAELDHMSLQRL